MAQSIHSQRILAAALIAMVMTGCGGPSAQDFSVEPLAKKGTTVKLTDFKGKIVILDFWATWCAPCRQTMPQLEAIYRKYKDKGLVVMGITDELRSTVDKFASRAPFSYPLYLDEYRDAYAKYNVETLPNLILIDRNGNIVSTEVGAPLNVKKLEKEIENRL